MDHDEQLKRQIEWFTSDAFLLERAESFRGKSPEACWAETIELCAMLDWFLDRMDPETRARAMEPEALSDDVLRALEAMQRQA